MALPNLSRKRAYYTPPGSLVQGSRVPGYLPYPNPVGPGNLAVPNQQSVDWPTAQFAQPFYPAGHSSVTPFHYPNFQQDEVYGGVFQAEDNPVFYYSLTNMLVVLGAGVLGYYTAKKGWDKKARAWVKARL